jgi:hypothetical protein
MSWKMIVLKTRIVNRGRPIDGQVNVAGWRHLPLISASGPLSQLEKS